MYKTILTELGIAVFDNEKCLKTFAFENPAEEYVSVKKNEFKVWVDVSLGHCCISDLGMRY